MVTIVGGSGKVGGKTGRLLLSKGIKVRLLGRHINKLEPYKNEGADIAIGDVTDEAFLIDVFEDADLIVSMIPTHMKINNLRDYQDTVSIALCNAIVKSNVKRVINLSSLGGHTEKNTGTVAGLARHETRLNALPGIDVLHLRPTYFMENLFAQKYSILAMNAMVSSLEPDLQFPMVATDDVAAELSELIIKDNFRGKHVIYLLGPRDYSMNEAAKIIGKEIGKPDLKYIKVTYEEEKKGLVDAGIPESLAEGFVGLSKGINDKVLYEKRTPENTTPTTLEEFAKLFAMIYGTS
ncbi:MAG TPA: NmrA family NAD(P)-binding protein [Ignavibacteriaceae bacterium]|nr:NmrA family NAD(P)-binding protein [Ignavibacteriaceae bacterium]